MSQSVEELEIDLEAKTRLRLWLKILKLSREIEGELRENLRVEFESTLPRFDVMAALHRFPKGLRMNELSAVLKVSNGNVTGIVDRLVKDLLVARVAEPGDRRALRVKLTSSGKKEFLRQAMQHEGWVDTLLRNVSMEDAETMIQIADKVFSRTSEEHADQ